MLCRLTACSDLRMACHSVNRLSHNAKALISQHEACDISSILGPPSQESGIVSPLPGVDGPIPSRVVCLTYRPLGSSVRQGSSHIYIYVHIKINIIFFFEAFVSWSTLLISPCRLVVPVDTKLRSPLRVAQQNWSWPLNSVHTLWTQQEQGGQHWMWQCLRHA